jgi:hypothetical protein
MQRRLDYGSVWLKIGITQQFNEKSPILNFNKICETVYGMHGKVHVQISA